MSHTPRPSTAVIFAMLQALTEASNPSQPDPESHSDSETKAQTALVVCGTLAVFSICIGLMYFIRRCIVPDIFTASTVPDYGSMATQNTDTDTPPPYDELFNADGTPKAQPVAR